VGAPSDNAGADSAGSVYLFDTPADLSITKTDFPDPVGAGGLLTYTITANNAGPSDAQDVVVTDTLPAGVTVVSTSGCMEASAGVPICTLGTVPAGMQQQYTVSVTADAATLGIITNQAVVDSSTSEFLPGDESVSETTQVLESGIFTDGFESGDTSGWN